MIDRQASKSFRFADQSSRLGLKNLGVIEASSVLCGFLAAWSGNRYGYLFLSFSSSNYRHGQTLYILVKTETEPRVFMIRCKFPLC